MKDAFGREGVEKQRNIGLTLSYKYSRLIRNAFRWAQWTRNRAGICPLGAVKSVAMSDTGRCKPYLAHARRSAQQLRMLFRASQNQRQ